MQKLHNMRYWLFPSNQKVFDLIGALHQFDFVDWRIPGNYKLEVGDYVFMYLSKQLSQIIYKMQVIKTDMPLSETELMRPFWNDKYEPRGERWARLKCIETVPQNYTPLQRAFLYHNGVKTFLYPQLMKPETLEYVFSEFDKAKIKD